MNTSQIKNFLTSKRMLQFFLLIAAVTLITYFFPREKKFNYNYKEGQPWKYDLLTAPYKITIDKDEATLQKELNAIEDKFHPIYKADNEIGKAALKKFNTVLSNSTDNSGNILSNDNTQAWVEKLRSTYNNGGIIEDPVLQRLRQDLEQEILITHQGNKQETKDIIFPINKLKTPDMLYREMGAIELDSVTRSILDNKLKPLIQANITHDKAASNELREKVDKEKEALPRIERTIEAGEKIVDLGDRVTPEIYRSLEALKAMELAQSKKETHKNYVLVGQILVVSCLLVFFYIFLAFFRPETFNQMRTLGFIMMLIVGISVIAFTVSQWRELGIYIVPFSIIPIILVTFFDSRTALYTHLIITLICAFTAPFALEFIFLQLIAGMTAIDSLNDLSRRSQLMRSALLVFFAYSFTYIGYTLLTEGSLSTLDYIMFIFFGINGVLLLFAYLLIYIFEKLFKFTSTVTLVELSDINNPILRQLSEECPGTFQHSMQVSNLAAEAANKIGAKAQLVRTGALYHDIGKLKNPAFFTENQSGVNPHTSLPFEQSAQIIISHIHEGLKQADKLRLPQIVKEFIATHHGQGKAKYFYNSYCNQHPGEVVDESLFTYPGPNPFTKEHGILMMADSVEAASRSLKEYTEESISGLVNRIIDSQIADGLLRDTPLSFKDVEAVKATFIEKLKTIYHTRISYPELKKKPVQNKTEPVAVQEPHKEPAQPLDNGTKIQLDTFTDEKNGIIKPDSNIK